MGYGFRLFTIFAANAPAGYQRIELSTAGDDGTQTYEEHCTACLNALESFGTLTREPSLKGAKRIDIVEHRRSRGHKGDPRIRFLAHETKCSGYIFFKVEYGRIGRYPKALDRKRSKDSTIAGQATAHTYRCLLMLPSDGKVGMLAVEDIYRNSPAKYLPNWISRASEDRREREKGTTVARRMGATPVQDLERLRAMIEGPNDVKLRLSKKTVSGSSKRKVTDVQLEAKVRGEADRSDLLQWAKKFSGQDSDLQGNGVAEMTELVDATLDGIGFTDAVIVVQDDDQTKKIGPDVLDDVFVYQIDPDEPPGDNEWIAAVVSLARGTQVAVPLELPDYETQDG